MSSLQDVCCITSGGDFFVPSKETIMEKRLVVSTLITAGRLLLIKCYVYTFPRLFVLPVTVSLHRT